MTSAADSDDVAYRKSVRNMVVVLAVVVLVLGASLALTYYFDVVPNTFQTRTSVATAYPFTLGLSINTTSATRAAGIEIWAYLNATATQNVTAANSWAFDRAKLDLPRCGDGFPLGVGVMQGHYTPDNYSVGTFTHFVISPRCPVPLINSPPSWFYFSSQNSRVAVGVGGNATIWTVYMNDFFSPASTGAPLSPGVYTAVAADEWGDFIMTNFRVS